MSHFIDALNYKKKWTSEKQNDRKEMKKAQAMASDSLQDAPPPPTMSWTKSTQMHLHRPKDDQDDEKNYWKYFVNLFQFLLVIRPGCPNRILCHIFYFNIVSWQTDDICTFSIWNSGAKQTDDIDKLIVEKVLGGEKEWSWISLLINSFLKTAPDDPL